MRVREPLSEVRPLGSYRTTFKPFFAIVLELSSLWILLSSAPIKILSTSAEICSFLRNLSWVLQFPLIHSFSDILDHWELLFWESLLASILNKTRILASSRYVTNPVLLLFTPAFSGPYWSLLIQQIPTEHLPDALRYGVSEILWTRRNQEGRAVSSESKDRFLGHRKGYTFKVRKGKPNLLGAGGESEADLGEINYFLQRSALRAPGNRQGLSSRARLSKLYAGLVWGGCTCLLFMVYDEITAKARKSHDRDVQLCYDDLLPAVKIVRRD